MGVEVGLRPLPQPHPSPHRVCSREKGHRFMILHIHPPPRPARGPLKGSVGRGASSSFAPGALMTGVHWCDTRAVTGTRTPGVEDTIVVLLQVRSAKRKEVK